jgi:plasmid stability protein
MATVTIKNIPEELYDHIKRSARSNRRSINSEIITCIEKALAGRTFNAEKVLAAARSLRKKTGDYVFTEKEITKAKNAGRP